MELSTTVDLNKPFDFMATVDADFPLLDFFRGFKNKELGFSGSALSRIIKLALKK